jgi:CheY-like chemotaxis protein
MSTVALLEELGHEVIDADSGRRALELLDGGVDVDLLLTDHAMPDMTGLELIEIARQRHPQPPILLATGYADFPGETRVPRLTKPFRLAQLEKAIAVLLDGRERASAKPSEGFRSERIA